MKNVFLLIPFILFVSCLKDDNPMNSQAEENVELLGWMDIEYIVTGPSLLRIGRDTEPGRGAITFLHDSNTWSEIIRMPITKKDRVTLTASLDSPGITLKLQIIARGVLIAQGESNSSVTLQYIF